MCARRPTSVYTNYHNFIPDISTYDCTSAENARHVIVAEECNVVFALGADNCNDIVSDG